MGMHSWGDISTGVILSPVRGYGKQKSIGKIIFLTCRQVMTITFSHPGITELVNLQEVHGQAKPYQIKQFLNLIERYNLKLED